MHRFCFQDAVESSASERLQRFRHAVAGIFSQNWELSNPRLPPKPMWIAHDAGEGLSIVRSSAQPMTASCFRPQPGRRQTYWALTSNKPYRVMFAERVSHFGAGEVVVLSNTQACSVVCTQAHIGSAFVVDGAAFEAALPQPQRILGRHLTAIPEVSELLHKVIALAWTCSQSGCLDHASPRLIRNFVDGLALFDLLGKALGPGADDSSFEDETPQADCRRQVKQFIDAHFRNPELSIEQVAAALGFSTRQIQLCFSRIDETASGYLRRKRILAAAGMLRSIEFQALNVTAIAFACGFNSSSHFANEFKAAFGRTATRFRQEETFGGVDAAPLAALR